MKDQYGIIGYPLSHSFSPGFFNNKFREERIDAVYTAMPIADIGAFPKLLADNPALKGLNVTIPYKEAIMPFLDELQADAKAIGAVNCIGIHKGKTTGYNTDIIGFRQSLLPLLQPRHTHALVLGTGGAAKAVKYVLAQLGISYKSVSRNTTQDGLLYSGITPEIIEEHTLIINTTPLGMYPHIDECPALPYSAMGPQHLVYDLIYNPDETRFLSLARAQGAVIKNGLEMLHIQALAGWEIWTGFNG